MISNVLPLSLFYSPWQVLENHINLLKRSSVPHVLGKCPEKGDSIPGSGRVPWINTEIIIFGRHALKAYSGFVRDVLCNQTTASGLKVEVELSTFDQNMTLRRVFLDYDTVVEARYYLL